jgi:hypothetical protein
MVAVNTFVQWKISLFYVVIANVEAGPAVVFAAKFNDLSGNRVPRFSSTIQRTTQKRSRASDASYELRASN